MFSSLVFVASLASPLFALPSGVPPTIVIPAPQSDNGIKVIPDAAHPFQPPGPGDQRGPCPGMNTLANHGYIPRNGVASFAEMVDAVQEGYNMEFVLGSGIVAFTMLTRGNVLLDKLSIGTEDPGVPPLPGNIDGTPGGFAKHGRFEGDLSITRRDAGLGNNKDFDPGLFQELLDVQQQFGDGDNFNPVTLGQQKLLREADSLANNPTYSFDTLRKFTAYGEDAFVLDFFANGTTDTIDVPMAAAFFDGQIFPPNWSRRASPLNGAGVIATANQVAGSNPAKVGAKDASGTFVEEVEDTSSCGVFNAMLEAIPAVLFADDTDPQVVANAQLMLQKVKEEFGPGCPDGVPTGPANV